MVRVVGLLVLGSLACGAFAQVHVGLTSDFQDGTLQGWGGPNCVWQADGGPLGAGDAYGLTTADGSGQGGKLAIFNTEDWIGNYLAAGVTGVRASIANFNSVALEMRIVLFDGLTNARWTSSTPVVLAAGSGWSEAYFSVSESSLTRVLGDSDYASVIQNVNRVMIRHDAGNPSAGGSNIEGSMGIDNVTAVPEPGVLAALGLGLAGVIRGRRSRDHADRRSS